MLPPSSSLPRWPSTTSPWWKTLRWTDSRSRLLFFGRSSRTPGSSPLQTLLSRWSSSLTSGIYSMRRSSTSTWGWVHLVFSWPGNFAQGLLPRVRWTLLWPNRGQRIHLGPFLTRSWAEIEVQTPSDGMCKRCDVFTKLPPRVERIWGIWCQRRLALSGIDLGQNSEKKRERSNKQGKAVIPAVRHRGITVQQQSPCLTLIVTLHVCTVHCTCIHVSQHRNWSQQPVALLNNNSYLTLFTCLKLRLSTNSYLTRVP